MSGVTPNNTGTSPATKTEVILDMMYGLQSSSLGNDENIAAVAAEDTVTLITYAMVIERDEDTGVTTFTYYDGDGNVFVPVNPMRIVPSTGSSQYATNTAYADGNIGTMFLAVRNDNAGAPYGTANGDYTPISVDSNGQIFVIDIAAQNELSIINTRLTPPDSYSSSAYENAEAVFAAPCIFYGITGYNSGPGQWIQIHNTTSVPADGAVPVITFYVPATSNFFWSPSEFGFTLGTGLSICNSTTGPTKTIGAADCFFTVQFKAL